MESRKIFVLLFVVILHCFCMRESDAVSAPYSRDLSLHYLMYAYASYCKAPALSNWSCYWCNNNNTAPLRVTDTFFNSSSNIFAFLGYNNKEIILSFRGTQQNSLSNWVSNLNIASTVAYKDVPKAEVHDGFYHAYMGLHTQIISAVSRLTSKYPSLPVIITGHSLGGALATLAAIDLVETFKSSKFYVWNYGSPRVGNDIFANHVKQNVGYTWRTTNQKDIVPHVPPRLLGFQHVATEVWFPADVYNYYICDNSGEDEACANGVFFPTSVYDHVTYLGYSTRDGTPYGC